MTMLVGVRIMPPVTTSRENVTVPRGGLAYFVTLLVREECMARTASRSVTVIMKAPVTTFLVNANAHLDTLVRNVNSFVKMGLLDLDAAANVTVMSRTPLAVTH